MRWTGRTFFRTFDRPPTYPRAADEGPTDEADPASVSTFSLDKYEVTVGRFRQFVTAWSAGWIPVAGSGKHAYLNGGKGLVDNLGPGGFEPGWTASDDVNLAPTTQNLEYYPNYATWTGSVGANENRPISCVNWGEAFAFCIWDGGFLPSWAEWEYAAVGGSQQRVYPWGSTDPGTSSLYAIHGDEAGHCYYPSSGPCTGFANLAPVGSATQGAGPWGQLDLAGNVWEWSMDWNTGAAYVNPCTDCASFTEPLQPPELPPLPEPAGRSNGGGNFEDNGIDLFANWLGIALKMGGPSMLGSAARGRHDNRESMGIEALSLRWS